MTTLRQLEYFVAIVEAGSFTRAAAGLNVTQPGLSHQFQALEKEVGGQLVERLPRGVRLTAAGRAMLPAAQSALADVQRAMAAARGAACVDAGELQLATLYSISYGILPRVLSSWRLGHPNLRVTLFEHQHTGDLTEAMSAGQADVAIGPVPPGWPGEVRPLGVEEFVLVSSAQDRLAAHCGDSSIHLRELADREWVHFATPCDLADILDKAFAASGFQPRVAIRTQQAPMAVNFAASGMGLSLVPSHNIPANFKGRVFWPKPPIRRAIAAYAHANPDSVTNAFFDAVIKEYDLMSTCIRSKVEPVAVNGA
ncbi:LysR family transcriptional regulator [Streptomyces sp. NPDC055085]